MIIYLKLLALKMFSFLWIEPFFVPHALMCRVRNLKKDRFTWSLWRNLHPVSASQILFWSDFTRRVLRYKQSFSETLLTYIYKFKCPVCQVIDVWGKNMHLIYWSGQAKMTWFNRGQTYNFVMIGKKYNELELNKAQSILKYI